MIVGLAPNHADHATRGEIHGRRFRSAIRRNITAFLAATDAAGWDVGSLHRRVKNYGKSRFNGSTRIELRGIATGAAVDEGIHMLYELTRHLLEPDECTVAGAVGEASASGATVLLKNSDKIGAESLVGEGFHHFKEINVVVDSSTDDGIRVVGVAAAGSTSLKMGVNDAGLVAASNIARTIEMRSRHPDVEDMRALDRGRLLRDGLGHRDAGSAAKASVASLLQAPMATPGNIEFADAHRMVVIEGSYEHVAVASIRDSVVARSNMFMMLDDLNDPEDTSSHARYRRALDVLEPRDGSITAADLRDLSQDHVNGPGPDSICRHSEDPRDETSLSAMVVATDPNDPGKTTVEFALGKPCWAWPESGVLAMRMDDSPDAIAEPFRSGRTWKTYYREDPRP